MLDSLIIENYRNLESLTIPKLARVNLLTGKNNTGKTSVLEAVWLYHSRYNLDVLIHLLKKRDELHTVEFEALKKSLRNLASNRRQDIFTYSIAINLRIGNPEQAPTATITVSERDSSSVTPVITIKLSTDYHVITTPLDKFSPKEPFIFGDEFRGFSVFVESSDFSSQKKLMHLWDRIDATSKEDDVIEALSLIQPISKVSFIPVEGENHRIPFVLPKGGERVPLRSMGDGINRILHIALAMANCERGYLLIDEFENGLHYSVHQKLWEIIFFLAEKLNVQVFATTHSNDAVKAFVDTASKEQYLGKGQVIKLQNQNGFIRAIDFSQEQAETAIANDIEIR